MAVLATHAAQQVGPGETSRHAETDGGTVTPERWREITAAFHAARASAPSERSAALDDACRGDESLRRDVEALLAADRDASGRGTTAVSLDDLPRLSPGSIFGGYRIDGVIGAGGMGQVYRAIDTRLGRAVALKLVLPDLALDPEIAARFDREATLLAALNHPNIAAIYEVEAVDGVQALVLELVEGPSLAARCPMPVPEALAVALQIASALEAAHARGIVHRDLKPGNVKIGPGNRVKVLDFGIAHATTDARGMMATQSARPGTRPGMVIGTPAYMSPEQARGLPPVDARTDIWAFGCVLFEMLTGRGAFAGDTASDSLARVIEREPEWSRLPAETPPAIARLLRRCLRKDPDERLHHIADARIEIADAIADLSPVAKTAARRSAAWSIPTWALPIAVTLALIVGVLEWRGTGPLPQTSSAPATEFGVTFPNNFLPTEGLAISPDGRQIAANLWSNTGDIWLQTLDGSLPHPLSGGEQGYRPFWSPDGSTIGLFQLTQLVTVKATGGPVTHIAGYTAGPGDGGGGTWSPSNIWNRSGVILYAVNSKLYQVAASGGGTPVEVPLTGVSGAPDEPHFLPDGRHFVFCDRQGETGSIDLASLSGGAVEVLGPSECPGGFAPPDHVLFLRRGSLLAQKLDLKRLTLTGEAAVVASGVTRGAVGPWPVLTATASETGVMAFPASRGGSFGHLTWFTRDSRPLASIDPPNDDAEYLNPAISPDGRIVAANLIDPHTGTWHIWLIEPGRGAASRLTTDLASEFDPVWSADGSQVLYTTDREGHFALYRQRLAGGSPVLVRNIGPERPIATDWSSDGRIVYSLLQRSVWTFTLGDNRDPVRLSEQNSPSYGGRLSPDGKWLVYTMATQTQSHFDVFVKRFPDGSLRRQISASAGGVHPRWTSTSRGLEVVYWVPPGGIVATPVTLSDRGVEIGTTRTLVDVPVLNLIDARPHYDVTRDGQRLLVRQPAGPQRPGLRVIVNWMSKLPH